MIRETIKAMIISLENHNRKKLILFEAVY